MFFQAKSEEFLEKSTKLRFFCLKNKRFSLNPNPGLPQGLILPGLKSSTASSSRFFGTHLRLPPISMTFSYGFGAFAGMTVLPPPRGMGFVIDYLLLTIY